MGLDAVELLLAVEAEFGVSIADGDAADLRTPRQLADHVAELLGGAPGTAAPCLSQAAFYRLRSVLVDEFGARRRELHPDTALLDCLGPDLRRQWPRLRQVLKAPYLPRLCAPDFFLGTGHPGGADSPGSRLRQGPGCGLKQHPSTGSPGKRPKLKALSTCPQTHGEASSPPQARRFSVPLCLCGSTNEVFSLPPYSGAAGGWKGSWPVAR